MNKKNYIKPNTHVLRITPICLCAGSYYNLKGNASGTEDGFEMAAKKVEYFDYDDEEEDF